MTFQPRLLCIRPSGNGQRSIGSRQDSEDRNDNDIRQKMTPIDLASWILQPFEVPNNPVYLRTADRSHFRTSLCLL